MMAKMINIESKTCSVNKYLLTLRMIKLTKIIILRPWIHREKVRKSLPLGINQTLKRLRKPFPKTYLVSIVNRLLEQPKLQSHKSAPNHQEDRLWRVPPLDMRERMRPYTEQSMITIRSSKIQFCHPAVEQGLRVLKRIFQGVRSVHSNLFSSKSNTWATPHKQHPD